MDGTFKSCPKLFRKTGQMYTVHELMKEEDLNGQTRAEAFPLVFALLPNKGKATYTELFQKLSCIGHPKTMIVDFEVAVIQTLRVHFPNTKLRGCFFHLNQSLFCKAQELGFQARYETDKQFASYIKSFQLWLLCLQNKYQLVFFKLDIL